MYNVWKFKEKHREVVQAYGKVDSAVNKLQ
jgi:hypothetical protein